jgi:predicted MFS family arabinose efflux permease
MTIGGIAGLGLGLLGGGWLNQLVGWRTTFMSFGIPGIGLSCLMWLYLRDPPRGYSDGRAAAPAREDFRQVVRFMWSQRSYRMLVVAACFGGIAAYGKPFWEPTFLRRVYGMDSATAGSWYFIISSVPTALGAFLGGLIGDRLARRTPRWYLWFPALANLFFPPLMLAFLWLPPGESFLSVPVAFYFCLASSLIGIFWSPPIMALSQSLVKPNMRALSAATWNGLFTFVGMGVGPWLVGDLSMRFEAEHGVHSLRYGLSALAFMPLIASVFLFLATRTLELDLEKASGNEGQPKGSESKPLNR